MPATLCKPYLGALRLITAFRGYLLILDVSNADLSVLDMTMEITDLAGLSQPLTKLLDVVSSAIGCYYRPKAIKNEADARAYEIKAIAKAHAEAGVEANSIQISAANAQIQQAFKDHPELAERARQRLLTREIEGQLNVESIVDFAVAALPAHVSSESVGADWRRKFFVEAENVCDTDLQFLWGKVLAGEVTQPGAYSMRTLDALRQLSKAEAELFRKACALAMNDGWIAVPYGMLSTSLAPFGLKFGDILSLRDAGLVFDGENLQMEFGFSQQNPTAKVEPSVAFNNGVTIQLSSPVGAPFRIPALPFTRAGKELQRLIEHNETPEYLSVLGVSLRQNGLVVKRGTPVPQSEGVSLIVFEKDL
ncbi:DUF2806 domain-containing protein [Rhodoferax sp. GW822-FHT02A01]|uniref:DUF2806 domain-containing protein n=1 Tax=Rhodoferax sp. GW822-FHT02A01 TaxID=3141537 RepID=UPI00315C8C5F